MRSSRRRRLSSVETPAAASGADRVIEPPEPLHQLLAAAMIVGAQGLTAAGLEVVEKAARQPGFPALPGLDDVSLPGQQYREQGGGRPLGGKLRPVQADQADPRSGHLVTPGPGASHLLGLAVLAPEMQDRGELAVARGGVGMVLA